MSRTTRRPTRRSRAQWQALIDAHRTSDLTQAEFCHQNGLVVSTFCNWKHRLSEGDSYIEDVQRGEGDAWLSLPGKVLSSEGNWRIELDLGGGLCLRLSQH